MSKSLTNKVRHELDDTLEDVAKTLRKAADALSQNSEEAVEEAAKALRHAAQVLADRTPPEVRDLARKAMDEAKAHPIATSAAVLSAAGALITVLGLGRRKTA